MPAILDDPATPTIYRVSGEPPYPDPNKPALPTNIVPRQVTLRDRQTVATVVPFISQEQVPPSLLLYLSDQLAKEIEKGDTYPMMDPMPHEKFASYWFQNFGAIMLLGNIGSPEDVVEGKDWSKECLGSFYIKPNYPGRSSHICNAGFLVTDASRNRGVGRLMGESYLDWAPKLGYTYSVFNLVYETNVASCKIWDGLGFKRIGRVPRCGNLKSYPGRLIDAIIYGRDLSVNEENDELVSEERFEKIKFYLKHGKYPNGADRAEKSRLRSAATHYKLLEGDVLMLKDKEVISDPGMQYDIARQVHALQHGGINKTTATIAEKYHWSRIKDTVSDVIRACAKCKDGTKSSTNLIKPLTPNQISIPALIPVASTTPSLSTPVVPTVADTTLDPQATIEGDNDLLQHAHASTPLNSTLRHHSRNDDPQSLPVSCYPEIPPLPLPIDEDNGYQSIDPQIMSQPYSYHPHAAYLSYNNNNNPITEAGPEEKALQQLLSATNQSHDNEMNHDSVDDSLDRMLVDQQDGVDGRSTRMDVDGFQGVHEPILNRENFLEISESHENSPQKGL